MFACLVACIGGAADLGLAAMGPVAKAQIAALVAEKEARTPVERRIASQLLLAIDAARDRPRHPMLRGLARREPDAHGRIAVDIDLTDAAQLPAVLAALRDADAVVDYASAAVRGIAARVPVGALEAIAAHEGVRFVGSRREGGAHRNTTSEGDATHQADIARATFGFTGNGQKVCVISDGIDTLRARQASGDVAPVVDVLAGQEGNGDEGTAMLEIVHDLAPGATLGFATGYRPGGSYYQMAQNVLDLGDPAKGKCTVIVDDIFYFDDSPFTESLLLRSVNTVTAGGVLYFSSAGNFGSQSAGTTGWWEGDFNSTNNVTSDLIPGHVLHEFSPGVGSNPALGSATEAALFWADRNAGATTDYDLYVLDSTLQTVLGASTTTQDGAQDASEFLSAGSTAFPAGSRLVVAKKADAPNRMLAVLWYRHPLTYTTPGSTHGHNSAADAFSIAATPVRGPYPGPFTTASVVEPFSSDGPRRMFLDYDGNTLPGAPAGNFTSTGGVVRNKPDLTAADGVSVDVPGLSPFFGTSASAPHAAAIAALVRQAAPSYRPSSIRSLLTGSALDLYGTGWDRDSGAGIVMATSALQTAMAAPIPGIALASVTPSEVHGNGNALVDAGEDWSLAIALRNGGGATATSLVATLASSTPGVVVTSGPVAYPNVPVATTVATPLDRPFRFSVFDVPCGEPIHFTLTLTLAESAQPLVFAFDVPTALVLGAAQTFSYTGPGVAIPDGIGPNLPGAPAIIGLPVSGVAGNVGDVKLRIDGVNGCMPNVADNAGIDHPFVGDLVVELAAPDNASVPVISRPGGANLIGPNFCDSTLTDRAPRYLAAASDASAPFTGDWQPFQPLSRLRGKPANGTWQLRASDWFAGDSGHVNRFSLVVSPLACTRTALGVSMQATKTVVGNFAVGQMVTYIVTLTNTGTGVQADNDGAEYLDVVPAGLTILPQWTTASSGSLSVVGNEVAWNGSIEPGGFVALNIAATIDPGMEGRIVTSQGIVHYDANHVGSNTDTLLTDDPHVSGNANPTAFVVAPPFDAGDIDKDGLHDALTDGLLIIRYLFGLSGDALVRGAVAPNAGRSGSDAILDHLIAIQPLLDVDANGQTDALTDGLLCVRYLFGLRGEALIAGAIGAGATRTVAIDIEAYLATLFPP
jgi:uncharacterized repeat protein (TIGR01451 family)